MKLVLHPGLHKTGTSYLQSVFKSSQKQLQENGVLYPSTLGDAHHEMAALYKALNNDAAEEMLDACVKEAREKDCHTVFLSSEVFCEIEDLSFLSNSLSCFNEISIIIYIRDPLSLYLSAYNQLIREPKVRRHKKIQAGNVYDINFKSHIEKWENAFPSSSINVFNYDEERGKDRGIKSAFCELFKIEKFHCGSNIDIVNKSYGIVASEILRKANMLGIGDKEFVFLTKKLPDCLVGDSLSGSCLLEREEIEKICDKYVPIMNEVLVKYKKNTLALDEVKKYHLSRHREIKDLNSLLVAQLITLIDEDVAKEMIYKCITPEV